MASRSASQQAGGPGRGSLAGLGAGDGPLPTAAGTDSDRDAADDRWIFWSSQVALFSLMTAGVTASLAARRQLVPPLVLAPLLDNALKYGGQTSPLPRRVAVEASLETDRLVITVANSGHWIEPGATPGTGLANLRRRLELLGIPHQPDFHEEDGLVIARLVLPAQVAASPRPGVEAATASTVHVELVDAVASTEEQDG